LIDQPRSIAASTDPGVVNKLSTLRLKYTGLVGTARIADPVAKKLRLSPLRVEHDLSSLADQTSLLIFVIARDSNPAIAQGVAQAAAAQVVDDAAQQQRAYKIPSQFQYFFSVVTPATPPLKIEPTDKRVGAVGAVGGVLAGAAAFLVLRLLPRRPPV
jgi:capsular polysaccharide biosynthesis protein